MPDYTIMRRLQHDTHGEVWQVQAEHIKAKKPGEALKKAAEEREFKQGSYFAINEEEMGKLQLVAHQNYEVLDDD